LEAPVIRTFVHPIGLTPNAIDSAAETLAGDRSWVTATDGQVGILNPNGSSRTITMEAEAVASCGLYYFRNVGSAGNLLIVDDAAGSIATVRPGENVTIYCTGTSWARIAQSPKFWTSAETTGTGSAQNVAHTLGVAPSFVLVSPTELAADLAAGYDCAEGSHTSSNIVLTVTSGAKFKILAIG
jgi:hypothetical protein